WSSDVCSSDLNGARAGHRRQVRSRDPAGARAGGLPRTAAGTPGADVSAAAADDASRTAEPVRAGKNPRGPGRHGQGPWWTRSTAPRVPVTTWYSPPVEREDHRSVHDGLAGGHLTRPKVLHLWTASFLVCHHATAGPGTVSPMFPTAYRPTGGPDRLHTPWQAAGMSLLVDDPDHHDRLARESRRLLRFAAASRHAAAFGRLDERGDPAPGRPDRARV